MNRTVWRVFSLAIAFLLGLMLGMGGVMAYSLSTYRLLPFQTGDIIPTPLPTPTQPSPNVFAEAEAIDQILINLYERINPSVVHINSRSEVVNLFYGTVPQEGTGSGFIYDDKGHIITNNHVIAAAREIDVILASGERLPATVVGTDPYYDVAVIKVEAPAGVLLPVAFADSSAVRVGQTVIAIGNPFGLDRTMTRGLVSALGRRVETEQGAIIGEAIQTDAAINPGNSGGPLLDLRGRVIGMNTAINSPSGGSVGIGFAVPSNVVQRVVPELIANGRYRHPSLGVVVAELGTEVRPASGGPMRGLLIMQLAPGGPAERAGLRAATVSVQRRRYVYSGGDIIVAVGGKPVASRNDLFLVLDGSYRPGDTVELTIVRDRQLITVQATLGSD